ncbi:hypothetical protein DVH24_041716, partial [Malus domestica]
DNYTIFIEITRNKAQTWGQTRARQTGWGPEPTRSQLLYLFNSLPPLPDFPHFLSVFSFSSPSHPLNASTSQKLQIGEDDGLNSAADYPIWSDLAGYASLLTRSTTSSPQSRTGLPWPTTSLSASRILNHQHEKTTTRVQVGQHWPGPGFIKPPTSPKQQVPKSSSRKKLRLGNDNRIKVFFFNPNKEPILKEALKVLVSPTTTTAEEI